MGYTGKFPVVGPKEEIPQKLVIFYNDVLRKKAKDGGLYSHGMREGERGFVNLNSMNLYPPLFREVRESGSATTTKVNLRLSDIRLESSEAVTTLPPTALVLRSSRAEKMQCMFWAPYKNFWLCPGPDK